MASIVRTKTGKWRARVRPEAGAPQVCRHFEHQGSSQRMGCDS